MEGNIKGSDGCCLRPDWAAQQGSVQRRERLRAGELGLDIYGLRAKLTALGIEYVD